MFDVYYFSISGVEVSPWIPPLVAFLISTFTSTGGVSGAFILLPFQMSVLGFTSPAVSATNHLYNVVAIPGGVFKYIQEGRMVMPLTLIVIIGTLPGVFIGMLIRVMWLTNPGVFKIFAGFVLLYIGWRVLQSVITKKKAADGSEERFREQMKSYQENKAAGVKLPRTKIIQFNAKRLTYEFYGERYSVPTMKLFLISLIVGVVGGAYGIGGGAIMAPIFVAFFGLPIYTVAGAALFGTLITSLFSVICFQLLAPFFPQLSIAPEWLLGILFGIGGLAGTFVGASLQKFLPAKVIKLILGTAIVFLALTYIYKIFEIIKI